MASKPSETLSVLDEKTFKHAIFRRGTKEELFREDDGEADDGSIPTDVSGDEKLPQLHQLWSLPRAGRDLSAAIWRPDRCAAELVMQKGKLFSHLGSLWAGKTLLTIEEAVYMVDRGSMLLFREEGKKKILMSMKECYTLMAGCGVTIDHLSCLAKLLRAGFVAHRFGVPWSLKDRAEANEKTMEFAGAANKMDTAGVVSGAIGMGGLKDGKSMKRSKPGEGGQAWLGKDAKRARRKDSDDSRDTKKSASSSPSSWWPVHEFVAISSAPPPCVIEPNKQEQRQARRDKFPHLRPLRTLPEADFVERHQDKKQEFFFLDVYPPNGSFSRKSTGRKAALVTMIVNGSVLPPHQSLVRDIDVEARAVNVDPETPPTRFCSLEHGDIAFYSLVRTRVRDIH